MKVALVMPDDFSLWQPRRGLISALVSAGHEVHGLSTAGPYVSRLEALGMRHVPVPMARFFSPTEDIRYLARLYRLFRGSGFDLVHNMTTKPNIYGSMAARMAGIPRIVGNVEGLGQSLFEPKGARDQAVSRALLALYRIGCRCCERVRFMNPDDLEFFVSRGLIPKEKTVLIVGEGVDMSEYRPGCVPRERVAQIKAQLGPDRPDRRYVVMTARPYWSKGVKEFVEASAMSAARFPNVTFLLAGFVDDSPDRVPEDFIRSREGPNFRYLGFWPDLKELYALADVVVHPSYMREGVPNSVIEAMAMGVPIVTTDNVGCRETVDHGSSGLIVQPRDSQALADATCYLLADDDRRRRFGQQSRLKAERNFDEKQTFHRLFTELYRVPAGVALAQTA